MFFLQQHRDYANVPWVICSICQKKNPEKAKKQLSKGASTTGLHRHIRNFHPKYLNESKKEKQTNVLQLLHDPQVSQGRIGEELC